MREKVSVLCSDRNHEIWPRLERWCQMHGHGLYDSIALLQGGELLLLISCTEFVPRETRERYERVLVIHESALPYGRGWSPLAWQILDGANTAVISLIEAIDVIDAGSIYRQEMVSFEGHELADEIGEIRDAARLRLAQWATENHRNCVPALQTGEASLYRRRTPEDSRIDPDRPIAEQFDLLRICTARFPAFFELRGHRYEITLRKTV